MRRQVKLVLLCLAISTTRCASPSTNDLDFDLWDSSNGDGFFSDVIAKEAASLERLGNELSRDSILGQSAEDEIEEGTNSLVSVDFKCMVCHWGANILVDYAKRGKTIQDFISVTAGLCSFIGIESKDVCKGMVNLVGQQLFHILDEAHGAVTSKDICGMIEEGKCALQSQRINNWRLDIPDLDRRQPVPVPKYPKFAKSTQKILHLSDPHVQNDYEVGARWNCGQPLCCSKHDGYPKHKSHAAASVGDYHCDLPPWTFDDMVKRIRDEHPEGFDFIFLTGDYPAHDVWRQNRTSNLEATRIVTDVVSKYFPTTPVFPTVGNHEAFPVNMLPLKNETGKYNPSWLYNNLADFYLTWLPGKAEQRTLREGGFYTTLLRPGLRLVSINSNVCNNLNFWLLLDFNDPAEHLHWIYRTLHKAELNKEDVYIIGHIPPGRNSCYNKWSHEYNRVVNRFSNTIRGQFFGHTHFDEFEVFSHDKKPIGMAYLAPSLTPHGEINPAYRIYEIDGSHEETTNLILDHTTYFFDLGKTIARNDGNLVHNMEYSAKTQFGLKDLSAESWQNFVHQMAGDEKLFKQFLALYYRSGPKLAQRCNKKCKRKILCHLLTGESGNEENCVKMDEILDQYHPSSFWSYFWGE